MRLFIVIVSALLLLSACNQVSEQPSIAKKAAQTTKPGEKSITDNQTKKPATPEKIPPFPIPIGALKSSKKNKDPQIPYQRYDYAGLNEQQKRLSYFQQIKKAGWTEHPTEQLGAMHIFTKNGKRVQVIIRADYFTLSMPKR